MDATNVGKYTSPMDAMGFQEPPQRHPYLTTLSFVGVSQWGGVRFMKGTPAMPQLLGLKMSKSKVGKNPWKLEKYRGLYIVKFGF